MAREDNSEIGQKSRGRYHIGKGEFRHHLFIESFGVKIDITSNSAESIEDARRIVSANLPNRFREIKATDVKHHFLLVRNRSEKDSLYENGKIISARTNRKSLIESLGSRIRLIVAEFAVGYVFVHAGVVGWEGKAIMIPGSSFSGKTTLTAALIKRGAIYYSDEYAILDEDGFVHPFPKTLSIRGEIDDYTQIEYPVEKLGGVAGTEKMRISMILIAEYKSDAKWKPKILSKAKGIMEIIKHTPPIRQNPEFTLRVLNQIASNAVIVKSRRADVSKSVGFIIDFFDVIKTVSPTFDL